MMPRITPTIGMRKVSTDRMPSTSAAVARLERPAVPTGEAWRSSGEALVPGGVAVVTTEPPCGGRSGLRGGSALAGERHEQQDGDERRGDDRGSELAPRHHREH